jgi:hypothetical protein
MKFKEYIIIYIIIFNITRARALARLLHLPFFQRAKLLIREPVLGPNRSHSHNPIPVVHGEDLNSGGTE